MVACLSKLTMPTHAGVTIFSKSLLQECLANIPTGKIKGMASGSTVARPEKPDGFGPPASFGWLGGFSSSSTDKLDRSVSVSTEK